MVSVKNIKVYIVYFVSTYNYVYIICQNKHVKIK